jgi:hypothetical protein
MIREATQPMRVPVHRFHADRVRAFRQAEGRPAGRVEPVCDVLDAVLFFDLHVAGVGPGQVRGRDSRYVVAIQKQRQSYLISP